MIAAGAALRLARHRHRGRRIVRLGRVPAGLRRRLAHVRAAARRLAVRGAGADRRRRRSDEPRVDMSARGVGYAVVAGAARPAGASHRSSSRPLPARGPLRLHRQRGPTAPDVAATDSADVAIAWRGQRHHAGPLQGRRSRRSAPSSRSRARSSARWWTPACRSAATASATWRWRWCSPRRGARTLSVGHYDRPPRAPFIDEPGDTGARHVPSCAGARGSTSGARRSLPRLRRRRPGRPDDR